MVAEAKRAPRVGGDRKTAFSVHPALRVPINPAMLELVERRNAAEIASNEAHRPYDAAHDAFRSAEAALPPIVIPSGCNSISGNEIIFDSSDPGMVATVKRLAVNPVSDEAFMAHIHKCAAALDERDAHVSQLKADHDLDRLEDVASSALNAWTDIEQEMWDYPVSTLVELQFKTNLLQEWGEANSDFTAGVLTNDIARLANPPLPEATPISTAFDAWKAAFADYNSTPVEKETVEGERAHWAEIDRLEAIIIDSAATTADDVAAKLWVSLFHNYLGDVEREDIITSANVEGLRAHLNVIDLNQRAIASAIISLSQMEG